MIKLRSGFNVMDTSADGMVEYLEVSPRLQLWALVTDTPLEDYCRCRYHGSEVPESNANWSPYRYDKDNDGKISFTEVMRALQDYFSKKITKGQAIEVIKKYFR